MTYDEVNDDLGSAKPFRVVAALAVYGRLPLLEYTIKRLYHKNGCVKVICSGDRPEDKELVESLGAVWVEHPNRHLGQKWNASFEAAENYDPDACVFVGSSDWISDNWFRVMRPYVEQHEFAGVAGCSLVDMAEEVRLVHWKGYKGWRRERADETIGSGRMLSRKLLKALAWQPFKANLNNSLDHSMKARAKECGYNDFMVHDESLKSLSLSTPLWANKHKFESHWSGVIPSIKTEPEPFLSTYFPETKPLSQKIYEEIINARTIRESGAIAEANTMQDMSIRLINSQNRI